MKRVLHCLNGTRDLALLYQNGEEPPLVIQMLIGIMMIDTLPLVICLFLEVVQLAGQAKKQAVVALFTSEAECIALGAAAQEAAWLQKLLLDLQMSSQLIVMTEDNQGAIVLAKNPSLIQELSILTLVSTYS